MIWGNVLINWVETIRHSRPTAYVEIDEELKQIMANRLWGR